MLYTMGPMMVSFHRSLHCALKLFVTLNNFMIAIRCPQGPWLAFNSLSRGNVRSEALVTESRSLPSECLGAGGLVSAADTGILITSHDIQLRPLHVQLQPPKHAYCAQVHVAEALVPVKLAFACCVTYNLCGP